MKTDYARNYSGSEKSIFKSSRDGAYAEYILPMEKEGMGRAWPRKHWDY